MGSFCLLGCISVWVTRGLAKTPSMITPHHGGQRGIPFTGLYNSVLHLGVRDGEGARLKEVGYCCLFSSFGYLPSPGPHSAVGSRSSH